MAAIRPTVSAVAAVWGTSGGRGAGEDKIFRPIGARFAPLWLPFGPLWVQRRPFGAHQVDEGRGKIKYFDQSVLGLPPHGCHSAHCL